MMKNKLFVGTMVILILVVGVFAVPHIGNAFTDTCSYATGGGGSVVARFSGASGYGSTKDVMYWPSSCTGSSDGLNVSFQFSVSNSDCPYIGVAWRDASPFTATIVTWDTGVTVYSEQTFTSHFFMNPDEKNEGLWYEIIAWYNGQTSKDRPIAVACGTSSSDAMTNAEAVAAANERE